MERNISFAVNGSYISKDNTYAGIVGEGGATTLVISFDESWTGLTKKITFYDAQGQNPVAIILTVDYMQDTEGLSYAVPIPAEPLSIEGEMSFVVDGAKDGVRQRAFTDRLEVKYAPVVIDTTSPIPPTPSDLEQLQSEIDAMVGLFITYKTEAAASAAAAAASQVSAANSAAEAGGYLAEIGTARDDAVSAASAAALSQSAAASSETNAAASEASASTSATTATNAKTAAESARDTAVTSKDTAVSAANSASASAISAAADKTNAAASATAAGNSQTSAANSASAAASSEDNAAESATASQSWAVGGTGTRTGENTNNAMYWCNQAEAIAEGGVISFNGRSGIVSPQNEDYTAAMVGADTSGSAATAETNAKSYSDTQLSAHNTSGSAHSAEFGGKADLVDGKVPSEQLPAMNYDPSGTAASAISTHDASGTAHSALFAKKMPLDASGTTAGTSDALTLVQAGFSLADGATVRFKLHTAMNKGATLNVNSTGAIPIVDALGKPQNAIAGSYCTVIYSSTNGNFILQGSGGDANQYAGTLCNSVAFETLMGLSVMHAMLNNY